VRTRSFRFRTLGLNPAWFGGTIGLFSDFLRGYGFLARLVYKGDGAEVCLDSPRDWEAARALGYRCSPQGVIGPLDRLRAGEFFQLINNYKEPAGWRSMGRDTTNTSGRSGWRSARA